MPRSRLTPADTCRTIALSVGLVTRLKHITANRTLIEGAGFVKAYGRCDGQPYCGKPSLGPVSLDKGFFLAAAYPPGRVSDGPAWAAPEKHRPSYTRKRCRLACQRGTRQHAGASGETNPAWKESLPPGWPGVFGLFKYLGREESPRAFTLGGLMPKSRIDSKKDGGHNPPNSFL